MKAKSEIHVHPGRVSVFEGGTVQVVNVLGEQCSSGYLPGVGRALAKGYANATGPIRLRVFDADGREIRAQTVKAAPRVVNEAKRANATATDSTATVNPATP